MERFYRFAEITFRIQGADSHMYLEDGVLAPFRISESAYNHDVNFKIVASLPPVEGVSVFCDGRKRILTQGDHQLTCCGEVVESPDNALFHIDRAGNRSCVSVLHTEVPDRIKPRLVLNCLEVEHHIVQHNGFLLHASFIRMDDRAILFTAPSGTGKSTQAELWCRYRNADIINGDRAAVIVKPDGVAAYGIPFCGTSGICKNAELPVAAIVYLSQAPESKVTRVTGLRAFRSIWEGCSVNVWDQQDMDLCSRTVMEAISAVPVFHLACTPDESAVIALEQALEQVR